ALLSIDNIIINDEIIECYYQAKRTDIDETMSNMLWKKDSNIIPKLKSQVANFINFIRKNKDLIAIGSIQIVGRKSSAYHYVTKQAMLLNDADEEKLHEMISNPAIVSEYLNAASYRSCKRLSAEGHIKILDAQEISDFIIINLSDCTSDYVNCYNYSTMEVIDYDQNSGLLRFQIKKDTPPETEEIFKNWVKSSIHRTISQHYNSFSIDYGFAYYLNSSFTTTCPFINKILPYLNDGSSVIQKMVEVDSPILNNLSIDYIANVKKDYGESFNAYKLILKDIARRIQFASSENEIIGLHQELKEKIIDEGMPEVKKAIKDMKKNVVLNSAFDFGLLAVGLTTMPASFLAVALQAGKTVYDYNNRMAAIKNHPSYFILKSK
ncbi:hypothetical protein LPS28_004639, partial [Salmonella enterica subsp. enterica serovar Muenster]|nr:hypothetical protein [Salmonella enterica subsp. enterica serovar Muenster]